MWRISKVTKERDELFNLVPETFFFEVVQKPECLLIYLCSRQKACFQRGLEFEARELFWMFLGMLTRMRIYQCVSETRRLIW